MNRPLFVLTLGLLVGTALSPAKAARRQSQRMARRSPPAAWTRPFLSHVVRRDLDIGGTPASEDYKALL